MQTAKLKGLLHEIFSDLPDDVADMLALSFSRVTPVLIQLCQVASNAALPNQIAVQPAHADTQPSAKQLMQAGSVK